MDMMSYLMGRNSSGGGKGAVIEVVTELPETGESNVIYLVPKQDVEDDDIFDEYLWVNNDWELIGSTGIDLSNYYTKSEIDAKAVPYYNLYLGNVGSYYGGGVTQITDSDALARLGNILTDAYAKGFHFANIVLTKQSGVEAITLFYTRAGDGQNLQDLQVKPSQIYWCSLSCQNNSTPDTLRQYTFKATLSWNGNTATVSAATVQTREGTFLATNNANSYTPTSDYHPATKKYVDDAVAGTGGGSSYPLYEITLGAINGWGGVNGYSLNSTDKTTVANVISDAYTKGFSLINLIVNASDNKGDQITFTGAPYVSNYNYIQRKPSRISLFGLSAPARFINNTTPELRCYQLYLSLSWDGDVATISSGTLYLTSARFLSLDSTNTSFTPTSDYHPATKKYVDDQIGSINTVLATLTNPGGGGQ